MKLKKSRWYYLLLIPLFLIVFAAIADLFHEETPDIRETYYLIEKNPSTRTESLDKSNQITIDDDKTVLKRDGQTEVVIHDWNNKTFSFSGKKYHYSYNQGKLLIYERKTAESMRSGLFYASKKHPLYDGYEKGTVTYKE